MTNEQVGLHLSLFCTTSNTEEQIEINAGVIAQNLIALDRLCRPGREGQPGSPPDLPDSSTWFIASNKSG